MIDVGVKVQSAKMKTRAKGGRAYSNKLLKSGIELSL
jgi:hypothetical protein